MMHMYQCLFNRFLKSGQKQATNAMEHEAFYHDSLYIKVETT